MVLIIYAHPHKNGHCGHMLEQTISQLNSRDRKYDLIDLYADRFDPVMHEQEHYTSGGKDISATVKHYQSLLKKHDKWILIYPVWWNNTPAILKGFFDKVFTSKYAFVYKKFPLIPFLVPIGLFKNKRVVIFSASGAKWWQALLFSRMGFRTNIVFDIMLFCGVRAKTIPLFDCVKKFEITACEHKISRNVSRGLRWLKV